MICGYWQCLLRFCRDCKSLWRSCYDLSGRTINQVDDRVSFCHFSTLSLGSFVLLLESDSKNWQNIKAAHRVALGLRGGNQDRNMTSGFISSRFLVPADFLGGLGQVTSTLLASIYSPLASMERDEIFWVEIAVGLGKCSFRLVTTKACLGISPLEEDAETNEVCTSYPSHLSTQAELRRKEVLPLKFCKLQSIEFV